MERIYLKNEHNALANTGGLILSKNKKRKLKQKKKVQTLKENMKFKKNNKPAQPQNTTPTESPPTNKRDLKHKEFVENMKRSHSSIPEDDLRFYFHSLLMLYKEETNYEEEEQIQKIHHLEVYCGKFFKLLEEKGLPNFIFSKLVSIKENLVSQNYKSVDEDYFSITIGTAPWPSHNKSSILNDDDRRNIFLSLKRLITFWQCHLHPIDPLPPPESEPAPRSEEEDLSPSHKKRRIITAHPTQESSL